MANRTDLTGLRFVRLTATEHFRGEYWKVKCDCGTEKIIRFNGKSGAKSCGCLHMEQCKSGINSTLHGDARKGKVKRLHNIWRRMLSKCYHEKCDRFLYYGARGIKVCGEWHQYIPFRDWALSHGYDEKLTIHRMNNDGNYESCNCEWVNMKTQTRNTRRTHWVTVDGETISLAECAERYGISSRKLQGRITKGWDIGKAIV